MMRSLLPGSPPRPARIEWLFVAALTLGALVVRLLLWSTQKMVSVDGTEYIRLAQEMAGAEFQPSVQPYGYPFLILIAHLVARDWETAARIAALATGLAAVPLTWQVARSFVSTPWLRFLPAAAVAFLPLPVRYSLTTMSEAPYLAAILAMFALVLARRPVWAGLAAGAAFAIRPEGILAAGVLALLLVPDRRILVRFAAAFALCVAGYVVGQGIHRGAWTLSEKTINIAESEWWAREPQAGQTAEAASLEERIRRHSGAMFAGYPGRFLSFAAQVLGHGGYFAPLVAVAGLAAGGLLLVAGLVQFFLTPLFALGENPRFVLPYLPLLWILAAAATARLPRAPLRIAVAALLVAGLALSAQRNELAYRVNEDGIYPELKEAGEWLRPYVTPGSVVYDRKPYTAFYAGARYRAVPMGPYDAVLDEIVAKGGDFLVVHQQVYRFFRPNLLPLVEDKPVVWHEPRLMPVYLQDKYLDGRTIVYRVIRPGGPVPLPSEATIREQVESIDHSSNHLMHGILAMRAERWSAAAGEFAYVLRREPENTVALNNRAWCLLQDGRFLEEAESSARSAVRLDPENPDYLHTLIEVLRAMPGRERAVEYYEGQLERLQRGGGAGADTPDGSGAVPEEGP